MPADKIQTIKKFIYKAEYIELNMINHQDVSEEIKLHEPGISSEEIENITRYLQLLTAWNQRINLTGPKDWRTICKKLIPDSFYLARFLDSLSPPSDPVILDIGAGAGIPGIPLRVIWPFGSYTLIEPKQKKSSFLLYAITQLQLQNTYVMSKRLEDYHPPGGSGADIVLSRAFTNWKDFLKRAENVVKKNGLAIIFSNTPKNDANNCPPGWEFLNQYEYSIADLEKRYFWSFLWKKDSS